MIHYALWILMTLVAFFILTSFTAHRSAAFAHIPRLSHYALQQNHEGEKVGPLPPPCIPPGAFFFFFFNEAETEKGPHSCKQLHLSELASLQNRVSLLPFSIGNGAILPWLLSRRNKKPHWTTVILVYDLLKYAHNGQLAEDLLAKALAKNSDLIASAEILSKKANFKKITKYLIVKTNTFTEVLT